MYSHFRIFTITVILGGYFLIPLLQVTYASEPNGQDIKFIAKVNGIAIMEVELRRAKKVLLQGRTAAAEQQATLDKQALDQLVSAELLYQAAAKQVIKDLDKQIDAKIAQGKTRFKDEQDFKDAIKVLEMDENVLREYTRRDILITSFVKTTFEPKTDVSEVEARDFYNNNRDRFKLEYKDEKVRITDFLKSQKINSAIQKYLENVKSTAIIEFGSIKR